jgi:hypothetical protein
MKVAFSVVLVVSAVLASLVGYIALQHNPMETYCSVDTVGHCEWNIPNLASLWLLWFSALVAVQALGIFGWKCVMKFFRVRGM